MNLVGPGGLIRRERDEIAASLTSVIRDQYTRVDVVIVTGDGLPTIAPTTGRGARSSEQSLEGYLSETAWIETETGTRGDAELFVMVADLTARPTTRSSVRIGDDRYAVEGVDVDALGIFYTLKLRRSAA